MALGVGDMSELVLAEDEYFIMGDNRTNSADSRLYGPVPFMSITGRACAIVFPPRRAEGWNWRLLERPSAFAALE